MGLLAWKLFQAEAGQSHSARIRKISHEKHTPLCGQSFSHIMLYFMSTTHNRRLNPDDNTFSQQNLRTLTP